MEKKQKNKEDFTETGYETSFEKKGKKRAKIQKKFVSANELDRNEKVFGMKKKIKEIKKRYSQAKIKAYIIDFPEELSKNKSRKFL